jgi:hypothetical protein
MKFSADWSIESDAGPPLSQRLYASLGRMLRFRTKVFETRQKRSLREISTAIMLHFLSCSGIRSGNASEGKPALAPFPSEASYRKIEFLSSAPNIKIAEGSC